VSIKFVCRCGKRLKARDEMAERLSVCPRCGALVGIPTGKARPEAAPLPAALRLNDMPAAATAQVAAPSRDWRITRLLSLRRDRRPGRATRHLEEHWYECLLYPLRAWPLCLGLAFLMTPISAVVLFSPALVGDVPADGWSLATVRFSEFMLLLLIVGLPGNFFDQVLTRAARGEIELLRDWGNPLLAIMLAGLKWLLCFVAGPILFASLAFGYWLNSDAGPLDWLIIGELGTVAIAYQMLALMAVTDRGRLRDVSPLAIADLVHRIGWRPLIVVLVGAAVLLAHAILLGAGISVWRPEPLHGWLMVAGSWIGGVFCGTFFFRLFGIWCYRSRKVTAAAN
jgi:hypothetical protein